MPEVAGRYNAVVRIKKVLCFVDAESKQEAIRMMLLDLASAKDQTGFKAWVNSGMETELILITS